MALCSKTFRGLEGRGCVASLSSIIPTPLKDPDSSGKRRKRLSSACIPSHFPIEQLRLNLSYCPKKQPWYSRSIHIVGEAAKRSFFPIKGQNVLMSLLCFEAKKGKRSTQSREQAFGQDRGEDRAKHGCQRPSSEKSTRHPRKFIQHRLDDIFQDGRP